MTVWGYSHRGHPLPPPTSSLAVKPSRVGNGTVKSPCREAQGERRLRLRRLVTLAIGAVPLTLATAVGAAPRAGPRADVVTTCAERVEGVSPVRPPGHRDLIIGPIAFKGLRVASRARPGSYTVVAGRRFGEWKAAPVLRAGRGVVVEVPRRFRGRLLIQVARHAAASAVRFEPCASGQRAFAYSGTVGRYTAWAGGIVAVRALCAELDVWVDGRAQPLRESFAVGRARCR